MVKKLLSGLFIGTLFLAPLAAFQAGIEGMRVEDASGVLIKGWGGGVIRFRCGTNVTCTPSGSWLTISSAAGAPGGGITTLNTLTDTTQTFSKTNDTNMGLTITSATGNHNFALAWAGTLAASRGGLGIGTNTGAAGKVLIGNGSGAFVEGDPLVQGTQADASVTKPNPILGGVWDGTNLRALAGDSSGRQTVNIFGTVPVSGTFWQATQPVSIAATVNADVTDRSGRLLGHVTVDNASIAVTGTVTANAGTGTFNNQQSNTLFDFDTGAGTQNVTLWGIAIPANGGAVVGGTGTNPFRMDPTGTTAQPVTGTFWQTTQPISGTVTTTPPANASTNVTQFGGNTVVTGTGAGGVGIPRVTMSNDSSLAANQSVNLNQIVGAAPSATNPLPMRETDGTTYKVPDPCSWLSNVFARVSQTANTQIVTGTASNKLYICSVALNTAAANNVAIVEGTGTVCATGIAGVSTNGTTAATGFNWAANGGMTIGNGKGSIMKTATNANNLCILQSAATQLSGVIGYVVAP